MLYLVIFCLLAVPRQSNACHGAEKNTLLSSFSIQRDNVSTFAIIFTVAGVCAVLGFCSDFQLSYQSECTRNVTIYNPFSKYRTSFSEERSFSTEQSPKDQKLEQFLRDIHKEQTEFSMNEFEVEDLKDSVKEMVESLLHQLHDKDARFKIKELKENGSFFDGTKIRRPDEFDFLAVTDMETDQKSVKARRKCPSNPGYAHVILKRRVKGKFGNMSVGRELRSVSKTGACFRDTFKRLLHAVIDENVENGSKLTKRRKASGVLNLSGYIVSIHGPQCQVRCFWTPIRHRNKRMAISIDICPAVEIQGLHKLLNEDDAAFTHAYKAMKTSDTLYLIPSRCRSCDFCMKMVFPEADKTLVQKLSETHRIVFRLLKLFFAIAIESQFTLQKLFNSFTVKMIVIIHSSGCSGDDRLANCISSILSNMIKKLDLPRPTVPSVFVRKRNVWGDLDRSNASDCEVISQAKRVTCSIKNMFQKVCRDTSEGYNFNEMWKHLHTEIIKQHEQL